MGWQNAVSVRALQVIVSSNQQGQGVFMYSGTAAAGNSPVFAVVSPGVTKDPFGNAVQAIMNIGSLSGAHTGFDANGVEYLSDSTGTTRILIDPQNRVIEWYDSSGTGHNPALLTAASAAGTDRFTGDAFQTGFTAYAASGFPYAQLSAGVINFQATSGQFSPGVVESFGVAGEVGITSGLATNVDSAANIIIDSAVASGVSSASILLQAAATTLNTTASSSTPSLNVNPGHNSAAPAAYSQSYEQANTNRINQILDVLVQTGIWHS